MKVLLRLGKTPVNHSKLDIRTKKTRAFEDYFVWILDKYNFKKLSWKAVKRMKIWLSYFTEKIVLSGRHWQTYIEITNWFFFPLEILQNVTLKLLSSTQAKK